MNYFDHENISSSDIKSFLKKINGGGIESNNLQAIFEFGSLFHSAIIEPHLSKKFNCTPEEFELARKMKDTFIRDKTCAMLLMRSDLQREEEFYKEVTIGGFKFKARCKVDMRSPGMKLCIELKGLAVTTNKAFNEAIDRLLYDLSAALYLHITGDDMIIIVGISKKKPELMFKKIIKRYDETFNWGEEKLIQALRQLYEFSPEDFTLVA